jgi:hypothetical protein
MENRRTVPVGIIKERNAPKDPRIRRQASNRDPNVVVYPIHLLLIRG